jgi:hypothetical protein
VSSAADGQALLARIGGRARPAGSAAEADARAVCAAWLSDAGFAVDQRPFNYSAFPGTWGTSIAGLALLVAAASAAGGVIRGGGAINAGIAVGIALVIATSVTGWWLGRYGTLRLLFLRREGVNLEARRGVPSVWLMAHVDSKSQPVSLLIRASAAVGVLASWISLILVWTASRMLPVPGALLLGIATCGAVASVPLLVSLVGAGGSGTLDNASGVAAVLKAASVIDVAIPVGVIITSAEELGLAGARAWVQAKPVSVVINCDGVDDRGALTITATGAGHRLLKSLRRAGVLRFDARFRRGLPGVLMDSTAFADEGWAACTISQGTRYSLARVHTADDTLDRMSGVGVERVAGVIASLVDAIVASRRSAHHLVEGVSEGNGTTTIE